MKYKAIFASALALVAVVGFILGAAAPELWAKDQDGGEIPFADAEIFFELNNTDGDLGIHALIDGEAWKMLEIEDPNERTMLGISINGRLKPQGLTELFFESAEPRFNELSPEDFFERFPEGKYEIEGITIAGEEMESTAEVTHVMPAPAGNVKVSGIAAAEDCDADPLPAVKNKKPIIISWDPVTESHPDLAMLEVVPIEVDRYQLVVEQEDLGLEISVTLPPDVTEFEIPSGFIALGEEFKFEILVREESGNQTAIESCFVLK